MMRLSEAIRLGALMGPQVFDQYENRRGGRCALGGALAAVGIWSYDETPMAWRAAVPTLRCPVCDGPLWVQGDGALMAAVVHLNDWHRWSRERIADWVETVEACLGPEAVASEATLESELA